MQDRAHNRSSVGRRFAIAALLVWPAGPCAAGAQTLDHAVFSPFPGLLGAGLDWTGSYAGLLGGYGRNDGDGLTKTNGGNLGGLQAGYNLQVAGSTAPAVFGLEVETSYLWRQSSRPVGDAETIAPQWFGAAKLRYGLPLWRVMPFATAGLAAVHLEEPPVGSQGRAWEFGIVYGGGIEVAIADGVSLRAEYDYLHLGRTPEGYRLQFMYSRELTAQMLKAGINVHFQPGR